MGQLTVRSQGSMGNDGSLAMQLEVAFRGDLAGATPVVAQLLRTPLRFHCVEQFAALTLMQLLRYDLKANHAEYSRRGVT